MTFLNPDKTDESEPWGCDCPKHCEARKRNQKSGTVVTVGLQCLRCGAWQPKRKAEFSASEFLRLPWYDEDLRTRHIGHQHAHAQAQFQAKQAAENAAWWGQFTAYLRSPEWDALRTKVIARAGGKCEACLERRATQVHHTSYRYVYMEPCFDLRAICRECHDALTQADRERRAREQAKLTSPAPSA